jgi:hypothetical protein
MRNGRAGPPHTKIATRRRRHIGSLRGARGTAKQDGAAIRDRTGYFLQWMGRFYACHANGVQNGVRRPDDNLVCTRAKRCINTMS